MDYLIVLIVIYYYKYRAKMMYADAYPIIYDL